MKANEGVQIWLIWFLNSALGLGECLTSRPGRFTSGKGAKVTIGWESGWTPERSRRCEDDNLLLLLEIEPRILFRPARNLVTAWTQQFQVTSVFSYPCESEAVSETRQCVDLWDALHTYLRIRDAFVAMILQWAFPFKIFYQTDGYVKGEISPSRSRLIYAT